MKRSMVVLVATALVWSLQLPAAPAQAASAYCSPSGDYCYSAARRDGERRIAFGTFSFRGRVRVCVETPRGGVDCRRFRLRSEGDGIRGFDVRWSRHFPNAGRGRYEVDFHKFGDRLGPGVSFRLR